MIQINPASKAPIYKQITEQIERGARDGSLAPETQLPSMNELAAELNISKETVKKAYGILVERGIIIPRQGKGFYIADLNTSARTRVLVIFDKFSVYKQILFNAISAALGPDTEIGIVNHNQSVELLAYYLDNNLDRFDWYVVAPHFPLDGATQKKVVAQLRRIPNRKLILLDRLQPGLKGNFSAVYQDFENDIYDGLCQIWSEASPSRLLRVITLPSSLYGPLIRKGVERFCKERQRPVEFLTAAPEKIKRNDTFLVLNSQLDAGLVDLARKIKKSGLVLGKDVRIISYNEFDMNELILGGLTTVSADFPEMGRLTAEVILSRKPAQIHCPFRLTRRSTF